MSKEVATKQGALPPALKEFKTARFWLSRYQGEIEKMLSRRIPADHFLRTVLTAFQTTPQLLQCSTLSVLGGIFEAAQLGLTFGSVRGQCWLIPYKTKNGLIAVFQICYRGYVALAHRQHAHIAAHIVYTDDIFEVEYGTEPQIIHRPAVRGNTNDENTTGAYAVLVYPNGLKDIEFLNRQQIEKRRAASQAARKGDSPWNTWFAEMARKCPIATIGKRCALTDFATAAVLDEYGDVVPEKQRLEYKAAEVLGIDIPTGALDETVDIEPPRAKDEKPKEEKERGDKANGERKEKDPENLV